MISVYGIEHSFNIWIHSWSTYKSALNQEKLDFIQQKYDQIDSNPHFVCHSNYLLVLIGRIILYIPRKRPKKTE